MLARFRVTELTPQRVLAAVTRRGRTLPHVWAWHASAWARRNRQRLRAFRDRHRGQRCFVLGNGPSLARMDLDRLQGEVTFGLNRIYLLFDQTRFRPTYYVAVNEWVLTQFAAEIRALPMPKFLNWTQRRLFGETEGTLFVHLALGLRDFFQTDITRAVSSGGTVTYVALQLAYFMGCRQVVLIGVDHRFADTGVPNQVEERRAERDANHFHPQYFPKGVKWQLPDLLRSEQAYALARRVFKADGREIVDATLDGACPVFRKVSWEALFADRNGDG